MTSYEIQEGDYNGGNCSKKQVSIVIVPTIEPIVTIATGLSDTLPVQYTTVYSNGD